MARRSLPTLRREIERVDDAILRLVGRRLVLARAIGATKRTAGLAIRDPTRERTVVARWTRELARLGIRAEDAAALARWMVDEAVRAQRRDDPPRDARVPRTVAIVGGAGAMGRWFEGYLEARGHRVVRVDLRRSRDGRSPDGRKVVRAVPPTADVVLFATPVLATPGAVAEVLRGPGRPLLADLLSVKAPILPTLRAARRAGFPVASLHPLFGPGARPEDAPTVLLLGCGDAAADRRVAELLTPGPLTLLPLPIRRHDRLMARLQALPRLANLATGLAAGAGPTFARTASPPSFLRQLAVIDRSLAEDPRLALAILRTNPHARAELRELRRAVDTVDRALRSPSSATLDRLRRAAQRRLARATAG